MFEHTLDSSWHERSRFGVTTLTSFGLQAVAVGALLILPLLRPTGIPLLRQLSTPISLGQPVAEAPQARAQAGANTAANNASAIIFVRRPPRLPVGMQPSDDNAQAPISGSGPYIPGLKGMGDPDGVLNSLANRARPIIPAAPAPVVHTVRLSHMSEGDLVHKVTPTYPPLARSARIQGTVVLQAMISKLGAIENLRLLSGHPMLVPAAIEAVSHWRYRPYILNNVPVEVETQITVNFSLAGN